jgi:uncharacterized protein with PIN domain
MSGPCAHADAVPVTLSTGETVASLCPSCDAQLRPEAVGCEHKPRVEVTPFGCATRSWFCDKCHAVYGERTSA